MSVIRQNFEYNLRILANFVKFSCKNSEIYLFRPYVFKKLVSFLVFFNKDYAFYTKNLFIRPKNCFQSILYKERYKKFCKNQFFSNIFTFLSVTLQNLEDNLRIYAILGNFHVKTQKSTDFARTFKKKHVFLYILMKIIFFTIKIYLFSPKLVSKHFLQ